MAQFLTTSGIAYELENIIKNAEQELILVTPFLKLTDNFIERLNDAIRKGVNVIIIYGKNELTRSTQQTLYSFDNIKIYYCENLHAKCYASESSLIIGSMNLYEFSEKNNREMGVLFMNRSKDKSIYNDTMTEVKSIINASELKHESTIKQINDIDYNNVKHWNPTGKLMMTLNKKYRKYNFYLEGEVNNKFIASDNFPKDNIHLEVSNRVHLDFDIPNFEFEQIKKKHQRAIDRELNDYRVYWNHNRLSIYLAKGYDPDFDKRNELFLDVIEFLRKELTEPPKRLFQFKAAWR